MTRATVDDEGDGELHPHHHADDHGGEDLNKTWTPDNRPADWRRQMNRWGRCHYARVAVIIAACALLAAALA
ncbi:hypothetical protein A7J05_34470 [Streptomyces alfalfae]|uniref:Uncharacterized protein n=1 Tax=Streptomyces alfalfae TaxID=1642299 RepID=A0ABM6H254_9ACTN|nr:hypothetical protein A7J05_34470 [Streptomyces alfalfae]